MTPLKRVLPALILATIALGAAAPAAAEPTLEQTLCNAGFALTGTCGIGFQEILCTRAQGINCFTVMPPGPYKFTLIAEESGDHASFELSLFTDYTTPNVGPLLFDGPDGNQGPTAPQVERFHIMDEEFGFTLLAPDDRFYSVNFLNPDPVPFGPGFLPGYHVRVFQDGFNRTKFLLGFEQSSNGGDEDFQDLVLSVEAMFECLDGTSVDSDGDGLLDCWESDGEIDFDKDGAPDVSLRNSDGVRLSDPDHKDLFAELDWRSGKQPSRQFINLLKNTFAAAPVDAGGIANPDGQLGINLWVDTGELVELGTIFVGENMGGGEEIPGPVTCLDESFYTNKQQNFDAARRYIFRYSINGETAGGENTCANGKTVAGKGELGGNDFIIYTIDPGYWLHELGHTLELRHGGFENQNNKPNYMSMMNYNYGLCIPQNDGSCLIDYAPPLCAGCPGGRGVNPPPVIFEDDLDEDFVLDPNDDQNIFVFRDDEPAPGQVTTPWPADGDVDRDGITDGTDWDTDGLFTGMDLVIDTNEDGGIDAAGLEGHDDWTAIVLDQRNFGEQAIQALGPDVEERSPDDVLAVEAELNTTDLALTKSDLPDPVNAGDPLTYELTVENLGPVLARGVRIVDDLPPEATYVSDTGGCVEGPPGTLTCDLDPLPAGETTSIDVVVVAHPADVAALPAPATIENNALVENRVPLGAGGGLGDLAEDPDLSNNDASEETAVNRPPVSLPGGPYVAECQGLTTDVPLDGSASFDPDGDPIVFSWSTDCPGGVFSDAASETPVLTVSGPPPCPVQCTASLTVTDPGGLSDMNGADVTVEDTTPPTIELSLDPTSLWPPNHKLVEITAEVTAQDTCDASPSVVLESIVSDEPDNGIGDGNTTGDVQDADLGTEDLQFEVRSERAGPGDGRTYTVTYTATDDCGNAASASEEIFVPHDQGN